MHPTLHLLQHRRSNKQFGEGAPNTEQVKNLIKAALRAPDHGKLKPYRFVVVEKAKMAKFHALAVQGVAEFGLGERDAEKAQGICQEVPMIIGVVAKLDHHIAKVPAWEQMISAGCATYALQLAAHAQGFDSAWVTPKWANGSAVRQAFGCEEGDKVLGLILLGTPPDNAAPKTAPEAENPTAFVRYF